MGKYIVQSTSRGLDGDKQQAIIAAARDLFTAQGYEATTIAQVAKRAGVAVGTVYLYFKNKPDLLYGVQCDVYTILYEAMRRAAMQDAPLQQRIRHIVQACFAVAADIEEIVQMMGVPPQLVMQTQAQPDNAVFQMIEGFIQSGIEAGVFRPLDPHTAAVISFGMVETALIHCNEEGGQSHRRYMETTIDALERWMLQPAYLAQTHEAAETGTLLAQS